MADNVARVLVDGRVTYSATYGYESFRGALPPSEGIGPLHGVPHWGTSPDAWDTVTLAGIQLPGICVVKCEIQNRLDKKTIPGKHGKKVTSLGHEPATIEITLTSWTQGHLPKLEEAINQLIPKQHAAEAVSISYPSLVFGQIQSCVIMKIKLPERDDSRDCYTTTFSCLEYIPTGQKQNAKVKTINKSPDITNLGPGAVGEKIRAQQQAQAKPSARNLGPVPPVVPFF